jgi:hypothetical protein
MGELAPQVTAMVRSLRGMASGTLFRTQRSRVVRVVGGNQFQRRLLGGPASMSSSGGSTKTPVPFIADHGLYVLKCTPGEEASYFSESGFRTRFGRAEDVDQRLEDPTALRPGRTGTARDDSTKPGWHFTPDRKTVFANSPRLCVTVEGGIGKTKALREAQVRWHEADRGNLALFLEANDLPTDVQWFLDEPPPDKAAPLLVALLREGSRAEGTEPLTTDMLQRLLERALRQGRLLLLVDAFDQISLGSSPALDRAHALAKLLRRHTALRCIISGRPSQIQTYGELTSDGQDALLSVHSQPAWVYCQVPTFTPKQRDDFLDHPVGIPPQRSRHLQTVEAELLTVPRFLERLRTIDVRRLERLQTASDVYWESLLHLLQTGLRNHPRASNGRTWTLEEAVRSWSLLAFEMLRQGKRVVLKTDDRFVFFSNLCNARREWLRRHSLPTDAKGWNDHAKELKDLSLLLDHAVQEGREDGDLRWQDQTLQDFFAAVWLTRYAGERQGEGEAGWNDQTWMTTGLRLPLRVWSKNEVAGRPDLEENHLWQPVWRFATGMPAVGKLFPADDRKVVCDPGRYLALMSSLLAAGGEPNGGRSSEMIYRCWPSLLALAGRLHVPEDRPWFEREVSEATTLLQQEIWKCVQKDPTWNPETASPSTAVRSNGSDDPSVRLAAWLVLARFLSEYPRIVFAAEDSAEQRVARDFESWFQPIPQQDGQSLWFPMSDEGEWSEREGETLGARLDAPFQLAEYPTTNAVYQLFEPRHASRFPNYLKYTLVIAANEQQPHPRCPVTHVTWFDSWCACTWLHSRLPSEHEWEYACRAAPASEPQMFWFGGADAATAQHLWCASTKTKDRVDLVGGASAHGRQPNPWNLYDVHGNVWEWTASWFFDQAEFGLANGDRAEFRVLRGGSFTSYPDDCRASFRDRRRPSHIYYGNGFRAARACSPR